MARPPRIEFPGALYHVASRGNARQDIFLSDEDRVRFLQQLERCLEHSERLVCEALGVSLADLRRHGNSGASRGAREIAVEVAARATDLPLRTIGERYGLSASGVTMARKRLRTPAWKKPLDQAERLISQASGKRK
jgi:hypothetical protein